MEEESRFLEVANLPESNNANPLSFVCVLLLVSDLPVWVLVCPLQLLLLLLLLFFQWMDECCVAWSVGPEVLNPHNDRKLILPSPAETWDLGHWHNTTAQISALTQAANYPYIKIRPFIKRRKSESNRSSTISSHYPVVKGACSFDIFLPRGTEDLSRSFHFKLCSSVAVALFLIHEETSCTPCTIIPQKCPLVPLEHPLAKRL